MLPALGHKRLSDVRRADVQELADRLTAEGLSASTVQNTLDPLRAIYRRAIRRDEGVTINPTKGLKLRRPDGSRERIATPAEAAALIAAVPEGERALWACAFYAGLRRGELRALRWSHIDLEARVIHVSRGWDAIEGEQDTKSAAGKRRVPILDSLAAELTAHKTHTGREGDALVFGRTATEPFNPETLRRNALTAWGWKEAANPEPAGRPKVIHVKVRADALEPITLHEARHTCASLLIRRRGQPQGPVGHYGALHDRHDVRHLRPPDARRAGRGQGCHGRLPRAACRRPAAAARGVKTRGKLVGGSCTIRCARVARARRGRYRARIAPRRPASRLHWRGIFLWPSARPGLPSSSTGRTSIRPPARRLGSKPPRTSAATSVR